MAIIARHVRVSVQLTDVLALCSNVEYLDVSYCNISDKGLVRYCADVLACVMLL